MFRNFFCLGVEVAFKIYHAVIDAVEVVMKLVDIDGFCMGKCLLLERVRMSAS